ncbi:hypothetical protein HBO40_00435 [Pseudomonas protegens]|uniref:hypothetical protein n=1 Tax=Pseudomonas TaxID=286 RepID=UPI001473D835|nr:MULTISPECIES: hypothetical protein [Pseudomonas]MDT9642571.1 hypothetical protein [Pseudomonas sp. JV245A]NMZ26068.1 hypothetical protein [Pseudomonas protegens]NMZ84611.1 hypothetical protein [Pseudomonas protegens]
MSLWNELGFTDNPYSPRPIQGDEQGVKLLVGRARVLNRLKTYLRSSDTHPTLEGPNGVGKTSLVSVAGYLLKQDFIEGVSQQALLPLSEPFQLTQDETAVTFKRRVLFRVAQSFIDNYELLKASGFEVPDVGEVNAWLNSPLISGGGGGVSVYGLGGLNASKSNSANTSAGFTEDGFVAAVITWLRTCFPTNAAGAFICTIDNLELLETSKNARALLEAIRDEVLSLRGLRWVLCGARGITRSVASSPRLQGVLADPLLIEPIAEEYMEELITARLQVYALSEDVKIPVDARGFAHFYKVGGRSLRNAMKYSEDFSFSAAENKALEKDSDAMYQKIEEWMEGISRDYLEDTSGVGGRAWQVFEKLATMGGSISPSQYEEFGFESNQAMRPHLRALEEANLIESAIDDTDSRRKTISVSSRGWIVNYRRSDYQQSGKR